jgi:hypothetical protein
MMISAYLLAPRRSLSSVCMSDNLEQLQLIVQVDQEDIQKKWIREVAFLPARGLLVVPSHRATSLFLFLAVN